MEVELLVPFVAYGTRNFSKKLAPKMEFEHFVYAPREHNHCRSQAHSFQKHIQKSRIPPNQSNKQNWFLKVPQYNENC